jgi:hypothetical protein
MPTDLRADLALHAGDEASEVAVRARVARGTRRRQQPLRGAATTTQTQLVEHTLAHPISVLRHRRPLGALIIQHARLMRSHLALHRLRVHTAHLTGGAIRPQTRVRVDHIHVLPR